MLSIKPIITVTDGMLETADRVRTRVKARERTLELLAARPVEWITVLHTPPADVEAFRAELLARLPGGVDPAHVQTAVVGPSVGPISARAASAPWSCSGAEAPAPGRLAGRPDRGGVRAPKVAGRIRAGAGTIAPDLRADPPGGSVPVRP